MLPRGIRNNNPLNIRRGKDQWQGLRAQQTDASFCQFESLEYGWRAAFYLLTRTYYHKYRLYTIRMIINKWAPPNENLTETYIQNVSRLTRISPSAGWRLVWRWRFRRTEQSLLITLRC